MVFLGMIGSCNSASDSQVSKLEKKVDVLMKAQVVKEEVITCPDGKSTITRYFKDDGAYGKVYLDDKKCE